MTGLRHMAWLGVRSAWPVLLGAPALAATLVAGSAHGIAGLYPTLADRIQYEATLGGSRASVAFNGRGYDLATTGGITAYEVGVFGQLVFPLLGLLLGIHLTRREEEAGRWDIVTAGRVSPGALTAAAALCLGSAALTTALTAAGALAAGLPARGAVWYALGIGALIGGLMPSTQREREAGVALKERAEPLVEEAKGAAQEAVEHLKPQAQQAAESVKAHATDSAQAVKAEGQDAAAHVKTSAQDSSQAVKTSAQDAKNDVQASRDA